MFRISNVTGRSFPVQLSSALLRQNRYKIVQFNYQRIIAPLGACQGFHSSPTHRGIFTPKDDVTFWGRTLKKLGFTDIPKSILKAAGVLLYMKTADEIDYLKFFKHCDLPDTYVSYFMVLELHVWILSARLMQHGKEGRIVRNCLINSMWEDHDAKTKKLEGALSSARKKSLLGLNDEFHVIMFAYDEGLMGSDQILAGALWRRFMRHSPTEMKPEPSLFTGEGHEKLAKKVKALEMLVIYVRTQIYMLNNLSREQLIRKRAFKWAPFDESLYDLVSKSESMPVSKRDAAMSMR